MDFEGLANLGWRVALIAIIALLVIYVVFAFLRIRRLKREKVIISVPDPLAVKSAVAAYAAVQEPESLNSPTFHNSPEPLAAPSEAAFPWNEPPPGYPGQHKIEALEREIVQLRKEVGGLRAEVLILREEQRRELSQSQVTQNASPLYSDAMQMALQGHDAATISQHCGISRAEAELVVALVRNRDI
ncbi:DUF2802 domain-containing protein [Propionivibrio sp.]|uniref:DUF2802 domain-containing protein n=1 Tax=Propionivibrio sp. TaxID=2212460 RepID=UPI003BF1B766